MQDSPHDRPLARLWPLALVLLLMLIATMIAAFWWRRIPRSPAEETSGVPPGPVVTIAQTLSER